MALLQFILYLTRQSRVMQNLEAPTSLIWVYSAGSEQTWFSFLISPALLRDLELHMLSVKIYSHFLFCLWSSNWLKSCKWQIWFLVHVAQITGSVSIFVVSILLLPLGISWGVLNNCNHEQQQLRIKLGQQARNYSYLKSHSRCN